MDSMIYNSAESIQKLLDGGFEMPIHFAAVGTNGAVVAGTYRPSPYGQGFECQITVQEMKQDGLTAPVNIMYVDRRGESALVVLRDSQKRHSSPIPIA